jgi:HEAT repeat protein
MTRSPDRSSAFPIGRSASAVLLAVLVVVVADARPKVEACTPPRIVVRAVPSIPTAAQDKKEPEKKEPEKKEEYKWPTEINGKDIKATMKDLEDPDPVIREYAARNLPGYGPAAAKKDVSKLLLKRMSVEKDPGVKAAVFAAVGGNSFDSDADNTEALRMLVAVVDAPSGVHGGMLRMAAIQSISQFGPRGSVAITALTGVALNDPSYGTRQNIAIALRQIGFDETAGPNMRALTALADKLARDESAAVRMAALESLMLMGPPWAAPHKPDDKMPVQIDTKNADTIIKHMRTRIGDPKTKAPGAEKDKQAEMWARLVIMRFDPKEINDENLDAIARYLTGADSGIKIQALQVLQYLGESASKKMADVLRLLEDKDASAGVTIGAINVLGSMGAGAKGAVPDMQKFLALKKKELAAKKIELAKNEKDLNLITQVATLEALIKLLEGAIKHIEESKPISPSEAKSDPKKDMPPKKP